MNTIFKIFLSMSFSGSLLILALFLGGRFLRDKLSRQWQYYVWLIVIARLLLPFGPERSLMGKVYQAVDWAVTDAAPLSQLQKSQLQNPSDLPGGFPAHADGPGQEIRQTDRPSDALSVSFPWEALSASRPSETLPASYPSEALPASRPFYEMLSLLAGHIWLIWLGAALGILIRKVTIYQSFVRFVNAGLVPVSDIGILDVLSVTAERAGVKTPVELCANPLISSPLLIGFFHPCIVLPCADISEKDFRYIALHELTHYKRRDMFYKWLVQITVCLHWFNPLVHLMGREINRACEFSCDEAVLAKTGRGSAQDYGKTLLDAMAAVGKYKESPGTVTLSENKQLLKERLGAIMKFKKQSKAAKALAAALTVCVILGAAFVGVYSMGFAAGSAHGAEDAPGSPAPVGTNIPAGPAPSGADAPGGPVPGGTAASSGLVPNTDASGSQVSGTAAPGGLMPGANSLGGPASAGTDILGSPAPAGADISGSPAPAGTNIPAGPAPSGAIFFWIYVPINPFIHWI